MEGCRGVARGEERCRGSGGWEAVVVAGSWVDVVALLCSVLAGVRF